MKIKDTCVLPDTARLLKDIGYPQNASVVYNGDFLNTLIGPIDCVYGLCAAPTHGQAMRYLREVWKIGISPKWDNCNEYDWDALLCDFDSNKEWWLQDDFQTYEQAVEHAILAAIDYIKKNKYNKKNGKV